MPNPQAPLIEATLVFGQAEPPLSHIRHATQGGVSLANMQPFVRELGGRARVFAHSGDLRRIYSSEALPLGSHRPVGQTDSELAFCALLERLSEPWKAGTTNH